MGRCMFLRKGKVHSKPSNLVTVNVNVTDLPGGLQVLTGTKGVLTVSGNKIVSTDQSSVTVSITTSRNIIVKYELTGTISTERNFYVNGVLLGSVKTAGTILQTSIRVSSGDTITIQFKSA